MIGLAYNTRKLDWIVTLIILISFLTYYFEVVIDHPPIDVRESDIRTHALIAYSFVVNHDKLPPNFLYDFLVALLSGFSRQLSSYYFASIVLISAAIATKFLVTQTYLLKYGSLNERSTLPTSLSIMMLFVFALPGANFFQSGDFYLGQLPPNVWHNPTLIFVMPFAVLLFFKSYELLFENKTQQDQKLLVQIALLIVINGLIKPSFLFTLIPSAFIVLGYNRFFLTRNTHTQYVQLIPYLFGILFVAAEYYVIYQLDYTSNAGNSIENTGDHSSIIVAPFEVWRMFSSNIFIAVITSLFFPLTYFFTSKGSPLNNKIFQFATLNFIIALGVWVLFAEEGGRKFHGNFLWQVVIATYILFLASLLNFLDDIRLSKLNRKKQIIVGGAFLLHFIWGIVYWLRIINNGYY